MSQRSASRRAGFFSGASFMLLASCPLLLASGSGSASATFEFGRTTRIADPKLPGGGVAVSFGLRSGVPSCEAIVEALRGAVVVRRLWEGTLESGTPHTRLVWNGKDSVGKYVDTGDYNIRVRGVGSRHIPVESPVTIVRLGITKIAALGSEDGNDEWQMVYFMKGSDYEFFATPDIHEYLCTADTGDISDLDLNNANPRPIPPVHTATDSPVLEDGNYEDDTYNYPLCYLMGAQPRLEVTFGASATSAQGTLMSTRYPVPGFEIRTKARLSGATLATSGPIAPDGKFVVTGPVLPNQVTRIDHSIEFVWQYQAVGTARWVNIPGSSTIPLRFYTTIGVPQFAESASGTRYAGPWVEVAEYWYEWSRKLGIEMTSEAACVEVHVKGFFGQNAGIPTAIEGMRYDRSPYYFNDDTGNMNLSALLNGHDVSVLFNCSDNMGATSTMLAMMGVRHVRPVVLGGMRLRTIWPIGAIGYTKSLVGGHSFNFHHVVTRDDGVHIIDTSLQLDEDGNPDATPGVPGWNHDRSWNGTNGYQRLSANNEFTQEQLQSLPGLR